MTRLAPNRKRTKRPQATRRRAKMSNWRDDEIRELLSIRADAEIVSQIKGTARDSVVYDQITNRLRERGVIRAKSQINNKLKALKRQYHQISEQDQRRTWCYFSLCEAIWGASSRANNPSDTEDRSPLHETDVSISNSLLSAESWCDSPPKAKLRRKPTRFDRLSAEMRHLFSEMDKDFNGRERLRLLEQREYEERVRREAQAEKAQEVAVLQDMTSLLRQMVQRLPATQPQCVHSARAPCRSVRRLGGLHEES